MLAPAGCQRQAAAPPAASDGPPLVVGAELKHPSAHVPSFDGGPIQFIDEPFGKVWHIFAFRHSMPLGDKAALWQARYYGRWIRWTGRIMDFTQNGLAIKNGWESPTFDVSLWLEHDQMPIPKQLGLKKGDRVTYVGRLDSYDDVFGQKLYLTHGGILEHVDPNAPDLTKRPDGGALY
jgi:hypothetical protein